MVSCWVAELGEWQTGESDLILKYMSRLDLRISYTYLGKARCLIPELEVEIKLLPQPRVTSRGRASGTRTSARIGHGLPIIAMCDR